MKNNKRILIIGPHPPLRGGISEFNYISYKNLKDLCNVFVISLKKNYPNFLFPGKSQFTKSRTAYKNFQNFNIYNPLVGDSSFSGPPFFVFIIQIILEFNYMIFLF